MKKLLFAAMAAVALCACNSEREYLDFRGLSLGMSAKNMCDSLLLKGFEIDTNLTDESTYVLYNAKEYCRVDIMQNNDTISDVLESYVASYNDSTTQIYNERHEQFNALYGWALMKHSADLHKEAHYQTDGKGALVLTLHNTHTPTVSVRYSTEPDKLMP
jgi:hypothetical protein